MPKKILFVPDNLYYEALKPNIEAREKGLPATPQKQKRRREKPEKKETKKAGKAKGSKEGNHAKNLSKQDREKFVVPKSVQAVILMKTIWEDGIFLVGKNKQIRTIDKQRLREFIGTLDRHYILEVDVALAVSIGLDIQKKDQPSRYMVQPQAHILGTREVLTAEAQRICLCWRPCSRTERAGTRSVSNEYSKVNRSFVRKEKAVDPFTA